MLRLKGPTAGTPGAAANSASSGSAAPAGSSAAGPWSDPALGAGLDPQTAFPSAPLGAVPQSPFPQGNFPQGNFPQGNFPQGNFPQGNFPQGTQGNFAPGAYGAGGFAGGGAAPAGFAQPGFSQPGYSQGGLAAPGSLAPLPRAASGSWKPFFTRLAIGLGALVLLLFVLGGLGLVSEKLAVVATITAVASMVGLSFSGRIWLIVMAFRESPLQGVLVLLVPFYWLIYIFTRQGDHWKPMILIGSALVPAACALLMLPLFASRYGNAGRAGPGFANTAAGSHQNSLEQRIQQSQRLFPQRQKLRTVTFRTLAGTRSDSLDKAEAAIRKISVYVPGSFRASDDGTSFTYQYNGDPTLATSFNMLFALEAGVHGFSSVDPAD